MEGGDRVDPDRLRAHRGLEDSLVRSARAETAERLRHYTRDRPLLLWTEFAPDFPGGGAVIIRNLVELVTGGDAEQILWASPAVDTGQCGGRVVRVVIPGAGRRPSVFLDSTVRARALASETLRLARENGARGIWIVLHGSGVPVAAARRPGRTAGSSWTVTCTGSSARATSSAATGTPEPCRTIQMPRAPFSLASRRVSLASARALTVESRKTEGRRPAPGITTRTTRPPHCPVSTAGLAQRICSGVASRDQLHQVADDDRATAGEVRGQTRSTGAAAGPACSAGDARRSRHAPTSRASLPSLDELGDDLAQRDLHLPAGVVRLELAEVGDVADVIAPPVLIDVRRLHLSAAQAPRSAPMASSMEPLFARPPPML